MLTSKLNLPLPGGWTKDHPTSGENTPGDELAAGVVGETGQILDQAGKPVARVTEGDPKELTGLPVAPTGEILNGAGEKVGAAVPLTAEELKNIPTQPEQKKGGVDLKSIARSTKGAYDTLSRIPGAGNFAGQVGKGLGFGGSSKGAASEAGVENAEEKGGEAVESLGKGEEPQAGVDADAQQVEQSQADVSQVGGSQVGGSEAPIDMEDKTQLGEDDELKEVLPEPQPPTEGGSEAPIDIEDKTQLGEEQAPKEDLPEGQQPTEGGSEAPIDIEDKTQLGEEQAPKEDLPEGQQPTEGGDELNEGLAEGQTSIEGEDKGEGEVEAPLDYSVLKNCKINKLGNVVNSDNNIVGRIVEGDAKDLLDRKPDENGDIWNDSGKVIGKAIPVPIEEAKEPSPFEDFPQAVVESDGFITFEGAKIGRLVEGDATKLKGKTVDEDGDVLDRSGNTLGRAERWEEEPEPEPEVEPVDYSVLAGKSVNKAGNVVDSTGSVYGRLVEGDPKRLAGRTCDKEGLVHDESGEVVGKAEPVTREESKEPSPFEDFPQAVVESDGFITFEGAKIGRLVEGDATKLKGKTVDEDGDVLDRSGNVLGRAERWEEEPEPEAEPVDYSVLAGKSVNKAGNVVDSTGSVYGRLVEGDPKRLAGRTCDKEGLVHNESGEVVGKAEPVTREESKEPSPFEDFPDATVESDGTVTFEGTIVGRLIEGDAKKLKGKKVDEDGDVLDRAGNCLGKAERWEPEEPEPEVVDLSILAGKRINKLGWAVDGSGTIFGRLVEGDAKRLVGRMCDKEGNVRSEAGDKIGRVELVPEGEREGAKDGPFAELPGCTVTKEGKVVTSGGDIVGRLTEGDGKKLFGRAVDEDGDVLDKNGNTIGKAERWEEEVVEEPKNPMCGRKINREGNCVDEEGNIIGKLTSGELTVCVGKTIDNDGDVVDRKGNTVGHASLLEDIPVEEETETPEEKEKREKAAEDKKLSGRMAACLEQCLDKIKPICKLITEKIDKAESTDKDELDEEALVKEVKPLIEQGHSILAEANGIIRGLDPDGHIQANAKHKTAAREASPEEYHLADVLKEITGTVTETIDNAKKKLEGMPHAKKALNPLWALLTEPLGQIIAAVGLLLNGVLELVGRLLNGLGLGGLVNNLLGGLGLTSVLKSLGVGSIVDSLTGQKSKK